MAKLADVGISTFFQSQVNKLAKSMKVMIWLGGVALAVLGTVFLWRWYRARKSQHAQAEPGNVAQMRPRSMVG